MEAPDLLDAEVPPGSGRKSFRETLAERDWLGIVIELVVVTVGVLLAFQISQWADRQKQAREEREFLERLYREDREAIAELGGVVRGHRMAMEQIGAAIRAKGNPALLADYSRRPRFGCFGAVLPSVAFNDTAFQEIVGSGKLNIVSDPQLRSALRDLVATQSEGAAQLEYGREVAAQNVSTLDAYQRYEIPADPNQRPPCNMDWAALVRDQRVINAVVRLYRVQQVMLAVRTRELAKSELVERKLACYLHEPGCGAG